MASPAHSVMDKQRPIRHLLVTPPIDSFQLAIQLAVWQFDVEICDITQL